MGEKICPICGQYIVLEEFNDNAFNIGYNQALEDIKKYVLNSCNNVTCRENINIDNDFDFYASELLDMLEEHNKQIRADAIDECINQIPFLATDGEFNRCAKFVLYRLTQLKEGNND